jgi:hypothetical protein
MGIWNLSSGIFLHNVEKQLAYTDSDNGVPLLALEECDANGGG